jgi:hypothetical protein
MLPVRVGAVSMLNSCFDVSVSGSYAYVAVQSSTGSDGTLQVVDVSDPTTPIIVDNVIMDGDPWAVYVLNNYAYVVAADHVLPTVEGGLRIVDVSIPTSASLVASYDTPGDPRDVFVVGDLVYVADYDSLQILRHIVVGIEEELNSNIQLKTVRLYQNRPNPFNGSTTLKYNLSRKSTVSLKIFDIAGRLVQSLVHKDQLPGLYRVSWDGRNGKGQEVVSSVYFYQLCTTSANITRKITKKLIKLGFMFTTQGGNHYA